MCALVGRINGEKQRSSSRVPLFRRPATASSPPSATTATITATTAAASDTRLGYDDAAAWSYLRPTYRGGFVTATATLPTSSTTSSADGARETTTATSTTAAATSTAV